MKESTRKLLLAAIILLLFLFIFSGYKLLSYILNSKREAEAFDKLAQMTEIDTLPKLLPEKLLLKYGKLYEQNNDLFGWISLSDTKLDYPVMHTPNEPEYYLRRAFDKTYSVSGVPFLAADCFEDCKNYLIYGHNMKNGTMFASVAKYKDRQYYETHKTICFDTLYEQGEYEVIAAFKAEAIEDGFKYWEYTDLTEREKFLEYIENVKAEALYDTGLSAEFGDELLTLSTCSYHTADGRFVVVAKKINGD